MTTEKRKARRLRRSGRGTVTVIAILLTGSAVLRLGSEAGVAFAEAVTAPLSQKSEEPEPKPSPSRSKPDRAEIGRLLTALQERETRLQEREQQIAMRTKALAVADEEIEKRMVALKQIENELRNTLSLADGAAEDDLARLTAVYENMKPKDAARLFEAMEPDFAAGFLGRMRPDAAAAVMAGLSPDAGYSISVILAGRNARAPKS